MNCSKSKKRISAFIDGSLDKKGYDELSRHLDHCSSCRNYKEELSVLFMSIQPPKIISPSPIFIQKVRSRIEQSTPQGVPIFAPLINLLNWARAPLAAAGIAAALLAGSFIGTSMWNLLLGNASSDTDIIASAIGIGTLDDLPDGSVVAIYNETL